MSEHYDPNIHDLLANMRRLDGTLPPHDKFGPPVNLIAPKGSRKYWIKSSTSAFGYLSIINYSNYMHYFCCNVQHCGNRYFLFLVLDKALCPFLVKTYDTVPIWHPTREKTLDALLDAQIDV